MKNCVKLVPAILLTAAMFTPYPATADAPQHGPALAVVTGVGLSVMDPSGSVLHLAGNTTFGIGVKLYADGSAYGQFDCVDVIGATFAGNVWGGFTSWSENQDGSVSFSGSMLTGTALTGTGAPLNSLGSFTVTIQKFGSAGLGHWTLDVPALGGVICDETVTLGQILIDTGEARKD